MAQGLSTVGSNFGLAATVAAVTTPMASVISKSGIPPLQKAGFIVGAALLGGMIHARSGYSSDANNTGSSFSSDNSINKFLPGSSPDFSPLQGILWSTEIINYACLSVIYLLIIQLVFKLHFKDSINLGFSNLLGNNLNSKLEYYFNKTIELNKRMSVL